MSLKKFIILVLVLLPYISISYFYTAIINETPSSFLNSEVNVALSTAFTEIQDVVYQTGEQMGLDAEKVSQLQVISTAAVHEEAEGVRMWIQEKNKIMANYDFMILVNSVGKVIYSNLDLSSWYNSMSDSDTYKLGMQRETGYRYMLYNDGVAILAYAPIIINSEHDSVGGVVMLGKKIGETLFSGSFTMSSGTHVNLLNVVETKNISKRFGIALAMGLICSLSAIIIFIRKYEQLNDRVFQVINNDLQNINHTDSDDYRESLEDSLDNSKIKNNLFSYLDKYERIRGKKESFQYQGSKIYKYDFFEQYIEQEIARALNYGYSFSLITLQINNRKKQKNIMGINIQSEIIQKTIKIIENHTDNIDIVGKLTDNRFCFLLRHKAASDIESFAESLLLALKSTTFNMNDVKFNENVFANIGVAIFQSQQSAENAKALINYSLEMLAIAEKKGEYNIEYPQ